ncbi:hypothetical protein SAMN05892883_0421 [Jatrophihabitans sp. GAS493]|uniref:DUF6869 domain-containing protein n=1 Tax=Jatrophihabitans sp. GAS493 TaxID=1907575 RepID=UPI000BB93B0E|nr:hypothetical protein [Jatrophihabitans sp. GAS493]SOD70779.1 hypothetical protein SAMN05892883_0421 [Jatrophihabitans sp. GAS493]
MDEVDDEWSEASVDQSGVCTWSRCDGPVLWGSMAEVASQYWNDSDYRRAKGVYGPAQEFVASLTRSGSPAAIDAIQALVDAAITDAELEFVGAGPLEDLVSHSGHASKFVDDVERRARQQPRFRQAVASMWLGAKVPEHVRARLAAFGAAPLGPESKPKRRK